MHIYISSGVLPVMPAYRTDNELTPHGKILHRYEQDYRDYVAKLKADYPRHSHALLTLSKCEGV